MTAYEVSVSKLAAFEAGEEFDIENDFDLYTFSGGNDQNANADVLPTGVVTP